MNKQSFYVTIFNTFIGVITSFFIKDDGLVAWLIGSLVVGTIVYVERSWINEHIFRFKKKFAIAGCIFLITVFLVGLYFSTELIRKTSAVIESTSVFLNGIKTGDFGASYFRMSIASQDSYPIILFLADHEKGRVSIQDFTIEQVTFNQFDKTKAMAIVSSPFKIYGRETLNLELVKEEGQWRVVFSRSTLIANKSAPIKPKKKSQPSIFKALFGD